MKILTIIFALTATGYAAITVPPEPVESNVPPGSIVVPPPRDTGTTKPVAPVPVSTQPATPQLRLNLADGSRLIGETTLKVLALRSEALGQVEIPLEKARSVKLGKERTPATVLLANGDKVQGGLVATTVALRTIFGPVTVPLAQVTEIEVSVLPTNADLATGLVAYYPFQEDAKDRSGNENHGEVTGAVFEDGGLRFRGNGSTFVRVRRHETLEPAEALTIAMWVKGVPGQAAGQGWGTVVRKCANCQGGYHFKGGGVSTFYLDGNNPCSTREAMAVAFQPFAETRWQHIAATCSRTERTVRTYQDGELVNEAPLTVPLVHSGDLYLGGANLNGDDGGFRGLIRDVRIYNRALSAAEVRALGQ